MNEWGDEVEVRGSNRDESQFDNARPVVAFSNPPWRKVLHEDGEKYAEMASTKSSIVESIDSLNSSICCRAQCSLDLSWSDYASFRGRLVQCMEDNTSRRELRKIIVSFLAQRFKDGYRGHYSEGFVTIDTSVGRKNVCLQLFIRILGIGADFLMSCAYAHLSGESLVSSSSCGKNYLRLNTIQAIARVSVEIGTIGQFNPTDGHVILNRSTKKKTFGRTNCRGAYLPQRHIKLFVGRGTRKRGTINFLTCAICRTLSAQLIKLETISAIMRSSYGRYVPSVQKKVPELIAKHLMHCRKTVLMNVHNKFKTAAGKLAKLRKVERRTLNADEVVEDAAVEDSMYLKYLNECDHVSITKDAVEDAESLIVADYTTKYTQRLARGNRLDSLALAPVDDVLIENSNISTSAVQLRSLMNVHNEHVTFERLIVEVANEMTISHPTQVLALQFDGCGKDKTKLPCIVDKDKDTQPALALMCPLVTWQLAVPSDCPKSISRFKFKNFDYIIPFSWCGTMSTDLLVSTLLDLLSERVEMAIPPIITIVFDNANSNKSIGTLRAFAAVMEQIPHLREVHLYFPSVGHTHGSVDQHFSTVSKRMRSENVLTVQDLIRVVKGGDEYTIPVTKFAMYEVKKKLERNCGGAVFNNINDQHYFLLFKNSDGDVVFNHDAFLRFAEPLSARVQYHLRSTRALLPLTEAERKNGVPIFPDCLLGKENRALLFDKLVPSKIMWDVLRGEVNKLRRLIPPVFLRDPSIMADLQATFDELLLSDEKSSMPLATVLAHISARCCEGNSGFHSPTMGRDDEERIGQHMRLIGKNLKTSRLAVDVKETCKSFRPEVIAEVLDILETVDEDVKSRYVHAVAGYSFTGAASVAETHERVAKLLDRDIWNALTKKKNDEEKKKKKKKKQQQKKRGRKDRTSSSSSSDQGDDDDSDFPDGYLVPPAKRKYDKKASRGASNSGTRGGSASAGRGGRGRNAASQQLASARSMTLATAPRRPPIVPVPDLGGSRVNRMPALPSPLHGPLQPIVPSVTRGNRKDGKGLSQIRNALARGGGGGGVRKAAGLLTGTVKEEAATPERAVRSVQQQQPLLLSGVPPSYRGSRGRGRGGGRSMRYSGASTRGGRKGGLLNFRVKEEEEEEEEEEDEEATSAVERSNTNIITITPVKDIPEATLASMRTRSGALYPISASSSAARNLRGLSQEGRHSVASDKSKQNNNGASSSSIRPASLGPHHSTLGGHVGGDVGESEAAKSFKPVPSHKQKRRPLQGENVEVDGGGESKKTRVDDGV